MSETTDQTVETAGIFAAVPIERPEWRCVRDARAGLGEVPIWSPAANALFWIDVFAPALHRTDAASGSTTTWDLPSPIGSYGLDRTASVAVLALSSGIHVLDLTEGSLTLLHRPPYDTTRLRFNDGACDPQGRFWVGTVPVVPHGTVPPDLAEYDGEGAFWRLDERGLECAVPDVTVANGIAFSPDGTTMYLADRPRWRVLALPFDPDTGEAGKPREFARVPDRHIPDGACVDAEGGYWIALFGPGLIARFAPDGALSRLVQGPTDHVTKVALGGSDGETMFVTTARDYATPRQLDADPLAGGVFAVRVGGVVGVPEPTFAPDLVANRITTSTHRVQVQRREQP